MKDLIFKHRFLLATICILALYGYIVMTNEYVIRHLPPRYLVPYFIGFLPILLASSFYIADTSFLRRLCWAIFMPLISSVLALTVSDCWNVLYYENIHFSGTLVEFFFRALVLVPIMAHIYIVSFALWLFCIVEYLVFRRKKPDNERVMKS